MEEYDPVHPTMSAGSITPGQVFYPDSPHSRSSLGSERPVPDIVEPEDTYRFQDPGGKKYTRLNPALGNSGFTIHRVCTREGAQDLTMCITSGGGLL